MQVSKLQLWSRTLSQSIPELILKNLILLGPEHLNYVCLYVRTSVYLSVSGVRVATSNKKLSSVQRTSYVFNIMAVRHACGPRSGRAAKSDFFGNWVVFGACEIQKRKGVQYNRERVISTYTTEMVQLGFFYRGELRPASKEFVAL